MWPEAAGAGVKASPAPALNSGEWTFSSLLDAFGVVAFGVVAGCGSLASVERVTLLFRSTGRSVEDAAVSLRDSVLDPR